MLSLLSFKGLLDTNTTTPILVDLHEFYSAPPGHRAKVTVSVSLRPLNTSDMGRGRQKHVTFNYLVSETTNDPVSEKSKSAPVCILNPQQKSPCGREQCESLSLGNNIPHQKHIKCLNLKYLEDGLCEDYFWESSFLVQENVTGLHSPKVLWPESAYVVQSW